MSDKPILFSGPMIQAILDGRKTQTRRVINPQPQRGMLGDWSYFKSERSLFATETWANESAMRKFLPRDYSPYGQPGDTEWKLGQPPANGWYYVRSFSEDRPVWLRRHKGGLLWGHDEHDDPEAIEIEGLTSDTIEWKRPGDTLWVRETWGTPGNYDHIKPSELMASEFDSSLVVYRATAEYGDVYYKWRPSIFMPRWASRITLRVKGVRVERVQEIKPEDCETEGISGASNGARTQTGCAPSNEYRNGDGLVYGTPREAFESLWDSINAKRGFGWHVNPFVWVVEFEKAEAGE